ncbi:MAG: site-specific integrase [bacterium]|nr:site-specific integrase [bacterium]
MDPITNIKKLPEDNVRARVLSEQEYLRLWNASPEYLKPIVSMAFYMAMRQDEIVKLTWDKVDLGEGFIRLERTDTKTRRKRSVPIHPKVKSWLKKLPRGIGTAGVFLKEGRPIAGFYGNIRKDYVAAVEQAGLGDFTFHDLRHCAINNLRLAGNDFFQIMALSGHTTTKTFQRYNFSYRTGIEGGGVEEILENKNLWQLILLLKQEYNGISGEITILQQITKEFAYFLEDSEELMFKQYGEVAKRFVIQSLNEFGNVVPLMQLHGVVREAKIYKELRASLPQLEKNPEGTAGKKPDFTYFLPYNKTKYYFEVKSLHQLNGKSKYKNILDQFTNAKIDIEDQLKKGKRLAISITTVEPYKKDQDDKKDHLPTYDPWSAKMIICSIIKQIEQNLKEGQFQLGPTILVVDLSQLPTHGSSIQNAQRVITQTDYSPHYDRSGELWHVAFGQKHFQIFKPEPFEQDEGPLGTSGILVEYQYVRALLLRGWDGQYLAFVRKSEEKGLLRVLREITSHVVQE